MLSLTGALVVLVFLVQTVAAMVQRGAGWSEFWVWVGAAETASWRLKWVSLPVMFVVLWFGGKIYRSIRNQPARFCGLTHARTGLLASATVAFLIALLIGVTVPARLRQRQLAKEAAIRAQYYIFDAAITEYRQRYHTYPADFKDLRNRIPDPYGTLAAALNQLEPLGYHPYGETAVVGVERSRGLRGAVVRPASFTPAEDIEAAALTFTKFELRLPGEDKIFGNDDDWMARDGILTRWSDVAQGAAGRSVSAGALQP